MSLQTITLDLPDYLYYRLQNAAQGMKQPFQAVLRWALEVGSPPGWDEVPAIFQADLAALDRLDDETLWQMAWGIQTELDWQRYQLLLDKNANAELSASERAELEHLRTEADRFALRKAHAAALLRWRERPVPLPDSPVTSS